MHLKTISFPAHIRGTDHGPEIQTVTDHLRSVANLCSARLTPVHLSETGRLAGLLHDMGKFTAAFADYIRKAAAGEPVRRGSVNHTFAGARFLWETYHISNITNPADFLGNLTCELLFLAIGAHYSQFDCYDENGQSGFTHRLTAPIDYDEAVTNFFTFCATRAEIDTLFQAATKEIESCIATLSQCAATRQKAIARRNPSDNPPETGSNIPIPLSFLYRLLLSALIDADRTDTARFMMETTPAPASVTPALWHIQREHLERNLAALPADTELNRTRRAISDTAGRFGEKPGGLYRMTVPTGGGKTLASLRAALSHAEAHGKQRIFFVIPLLSVLEQNAHVIRDNLLDDPALSAHHLPTPCIVEHHSNVLRDTAASDELNLNELITESWQAPILITTLEQLLYTLFDGRPSCIRRMQALTNSVIVIDEVQTVPRKMLSLFNEAINFLTDLCGATVILTSATQPCFEEMPHPMNEAEEIIPYDEAQWRVFRRTVPTDHTDPSMTAEDLAAFAWDIAETAGSLLIVCNKKSEARDLYGLLSDRAADTDTEIYHLSTAMCMRHGESATPPRVLRRVGE